uniref:Uncharacterized protein n=1 Tax=Arundo donax TaxID=35708 RepID=A0A0A9GYN8_ARUDO
MMMYGWAARLGLVCGSSIRVS